MNSKKLFTAFAATALIVVIVFSSTVIAAPAVQSYLNVIIQNKQGINPDVPVIVNDEDPVDVSVDGTVPVDVSGWKHTTTTGSRSAEISGMQVDTTEIETKGYRQITIAIFTDTNTDYVNYLESYESNGNEFYLSDPHYWKAVNMRVNGRTQISETFDVISESMFIHIIETRDEPASVTITWFLTT